MNEMKHRACTDPDILRAFVPTPKPPAKVRDFLSSMQHFFRVRCKLVLTVQADAYINILTRAPVTCYAEKVGQGSIGLLVM